MTLTDGIIILVIVSILTFVNMKIVKERKRGAKCVTCLGCPYSGD